MASWNNGYVADIAYIEGFYQQQSPARMALACLIGNVAVDLPAPQDNASYLELGCGCGIGALLIAASNPGWQVSAIDYNPTHIAIGSAIADAARLDNIHFIEADLSQLAGSAQARAIPSADFVSMHGVWSWVASDVRAGIVRLLAEKTRPGSMVHLSYNAMPSWQGAIGFQRIVYEGGVRSPGRSNRQAEAGLALARELKETGAQYLSESPLVGNLLARLGDSSIEYLSHEFMNAHWAPSFHADVAAAMVEAKLTWVASANPLENFPELMLTAEQRAVMDRYDDPIMRELLKDTCMPRQFRHDVYVRGARRLSNYERDAAISRLTAVPVVGIGEMQTTLQVPAGTAEMGESLKEMMAAAMRGPATIGELLAQHPGHSNPSELVGVLVGSSQWQIVMRPDDIQPDSADRLNRILGSRERSLVGPQGSAGLASGLLGTGLTVPPVVQFIAARLLAGEREDDADGWAKTLCTDVLPEKHETVRTVVRTAIEQRVPILRQLRIVPS